MDLEEKLKKIVNDTGEVTPVYGGYEVRVGKRALFPWDRVVTLLIESGQKIWVSKKEGHLCITSEPNLQ